MHLNKLTADLPKAPQTKLIVFPLEVSRTKKEKREQTNFRYEANQCLITL